MDDVERSQLQQEVMLMANLSHPHKQSVTIAYTGFCLNELCEKPLPAPKRWCNAECREAWQQEQRYANPKTG